jgi:hypothetical protein
VEIYLLKNGDLPFSAHANKTERGARMNPDQNASSKPAPAKKPAVKESGWTKYIYVIGFIGFLVAIAVAGAKSSSSSLANIPFISKLNEFVKKTTGTSILFDEASKYEHGCPLHQFDSVKVLSRSPDIMIIEGFLTKFEAEYLINLAYPPPSKFRELIFG